MERLTTKRKDGRWALRNDDGATPKEQINKIPRAIDRLAAYEDTGLQPEEILTLISMSERAKMADLLRLEEYQAIETINHLQELAQAEKDGRLVVLPCKVGNEVFVDVRTLPYNYLHPADGCIDYAKREIVSIATTKKETYMKLRALYPSRAGKREYLRYGVAAVGKTVFLTREEAETALKKRVED